MIVACGAIHTPLLLRRNGLGGELRRARPQPRDPPCHRGARAVRRGRRHGRGVPQSFYIDEFADEGIMFEGAAGPPDYLAMSMPFSRERHRELMLRFRNLVPVRRDGLRPLARRGARARSAGWRSATTSAGEDVATLRRAGSSCSSELYWAAGARGLTAGGSGAARATATGPLRGLRCGSRPDADGLPPARHRARRRRDPRGRGGRRPALHGVDGLYVSDASAVPSSLGVNPQITIMALATRLALPPARRAAAGRRAGAVEHRRAADRRAHAGDCPERLARSARRDAVGHPLGHRRRSFASRPTR